MNNAERKIKDNFPSLSSSDIKLLLSASVIKKVAGGEILVREGEFNANVFIVFEGLLRSFVIKSDGKERTIFLTKDKMRIGSFNSIFKNSPSEITIESLEPSEILVIDSRKFQELIKSNMNLVSIEKMGMQQFLEDAMERMYFFTVLSPEERFISFREKHPELIQRVPQKYLASLLGLTTVSLSRIKSRITKK